VLVSQEGWEGGDARPKLASALSHAIDMQEQARSGKGFLEPTRQAWKGTKKEKNSP